MTVDPVVSVETKLVTTDSDRSAIDHFGLSVALSGDTALIGSYGAACTAGGGCGAAYVFTRIGNTWSQQQILSAADAAAGDSFGWSVALSTDTAIIGALYDVTPGMEGTLMPQDGIWVAVLNGAAGKTIKLLIPATSAN